MQTATVVRACLAGACLGWLVLPVAARAYELRMSADGTPLRWAGETVALSIDPSSEALGGPGVVRGVVEAVAQEWSQVERAPRVALVEHSAGEIGYDPRRPRDDVSGVFFIAENWPFDPDAIAVTIVTYLESSGEIVDADIAIRGEGIPFSMEDVPRGEAAYDLQNALAHEIGHVLGLDESVDHPEATMFPSAAMGETTKRTIAADDMDGAAEIYGYPDPSAPSCSVATSRGTRASRPSAAVVASIFAALVVVLVTLWLRRAPRASRSRCGARWAAALAIAPAIGLLAEPTIAYAPHAPHAREAASPEATSDEGRAVVGRRTERRGGLLFTTVDLESRRSPCSAGTSCPAHSVTVVIPGGRDGDVAQWVSHTRIP